MLKQLSTTEEAKIRGLKNGQKVICKTEGEASICGQIFVSDKEFSVRFPGGSFIELDDGVFDVVVRQEGDYGTIITF